MATAATTIRNGEKAAGTSVSAAASLVATIRAATATSPMTIPAPSGDALRLNGAVATWNGGRPARTANPPSSTITGIANGSVTPAPRKAPRTDERSAVPAAAYTNAN